MVNIPGWHTNRKIVVFESDDWGSIRMSSNKNMKSLIRDGFNFDNQSFNQFDALETDTDVEMLFDTLIKYKDMNGKSPVFTLAGIVANPDFMKIENENFTQYFYEPFTDTLKRYGNSDQVYNLQLEGIRNQLIYPIFHGREHLNVQQWLKLLQSGNKSIHRAFQAGITGVHKGMFDEYLGDFQAAFNLTDINDLLYHVNVIKEGLDLFNNLWGYKSAYFVATNGPFHTSLEKTLWEHSVKYIYTERIHKEPVGDDKYKKHFRYIGLKNRWNQVYLTRNAFFEPSIEGGGLNINPVENCMKSVERAFRWGKPAVISTHRVNYAGRVNPKNRANTHLLLHQLLKMMLKKWPDIEFINSVELGELISKK